MQKDTFNKLVLVLYTEYYKTLLGEILKELGACKIYNIHVLEDSKLLM